MPRLVNDSHAATANLAQNLIVADRFRVRASADLAFGWNLLGAVCGGLLEFFSMWLGFRALTLVAVAAYLLAFLLAARDQEPGPLDPSTAAV